MAKFKANPVIVDAFTITSVSAKDADGNISVTLDNGLVELCTPDKTARMTPNVGDYVVQQADGYIYLNPKAVFENKYSPITE